MTQPHAPTRRRSAVLCIGLWVAFSAAVAGCQSGTRPPTKAVAPYAGPGVELDSSGAQHVAVLRAPSAGWAFTLDRTEPAPNGTDIFVTATRPDPAFMHAQVECLLRTGTGVAVSRPIHVFVRVLNHGSSPGNMAYQPAGADRKTTGR